MYICTELYDEAHQKTLRMEKDESSSALSTYENYANVGGQPDYLNVSHALPPLTTTARALPKKLKW